MVSKIFGVSLGLFVGWAVLVSSAVFMVSGSIPAATSTLLLISPNLVHHPGWISFTSILWISAISIIAIKGIKPAAYLQVLMTGFEILFLLLIIILGIMKYAEQPAHAFSLSWLSLTGFSPSLFARGALIAVFLYWGWDVALNLNEETKNTQHIPGLGAFWSVLIIILLFVCFAIATLLVLSDGEIQHAGTNIIFAVADKLLPRPWSFLAVFCVMLSTIGTLQTTLVQFTRTLFAEARDGKIHSRYAKLHPSWDTPWLAVVLIWSLGTVFLFLSSYYPSVNLIIEDSVNAIGLLVAFYYSITGLACAWYYRSMWNSIYELIIFILWPTLSALFLIFISCFSLPKFSSITLIIGIGGIVSGVIPLWLHYHSRHNLS